MNIRCRSSMGQKEKFGELIEKARYFRKFSKAKYSQFCVGAALEDNQGNIFGGTNVESSSYGLTICAEQVALTKALSEGSEKFKNIAIVGPDDKFCPPCGACRQLLHDYAPDINIILQKDNELYVLSLKELLPHAFDDTKLK